MHTLEEDSFYQHSPFLSCGVGCVDIYLEELGIRQATIFYKSSRNIKFCCDSNLIR
jgi:hypothetical protein